jgi:O-glycosyl hydrolase
MHLTEGGLRLFGSTWTVPKWITTNGEYVGGYVRKSMYQTWANYFVKFLEEYDKRGIDFWGVTTQNEPSSAMTSDEINSVGWTSMEMVSRRDLFCQICKHRVPVLSNLQTCRVFGSERIWVRRCETPNIQTSS